MHFSWLIYSAIVPSFIFTVTAESPETGIRIPLTKRSTFLTPNGDIDPAAVRAEARHIQNKYARAFARYEANTGKRHPLDSNSYEKRMLKHRAATTTLGHIELYPADDPGYGLDSYAWAGQVHIGSTSKTYSILFDTGSSDLIVPDVACTTCGSHAYYDPKTSLTSRATGKTFKVTFGTDSVQSSCKGLLYRDKVTVGGYSIAQQVIGAATTYSSALAKINADGLLGLGWPSLTAFNISGYEPVMQNLIKQKSIKQGIFGFMSGEVPGAELCLGCTDNKYGGGLIGYSPILHQSFWHIDMNSVVLSNRYAVVRGTSAIIDTGTSIMWAPKAHVQAIYAHIPGSEDASATFGPGAYTYPCANFFDNATFAFPGGNIVLNGPLFSKGPISKGSHTCLGALAYHSESYWILGVAFLNQVYTVFDVTNARVGFQNFV